ncbi:hypothetical protein NHJ13734_000540 [Beauveria thailandica]
MGSKTLEDEDPGRQDAPPANGSNGTGGEPRGKHISRDGDGCVGSDGCGEDDDDDDDDEAEAAAAAALAGAAESTANKKKKRKRSKKKKKAAASLQQSSPPRVPLDELVPLGDFRPGQLMEYNAPLDTSVRARAEELRTQGRPNLEDAEFLSNYRKSAEIHRQVRHWVQETVKPGHTLTEIAVGIEDGVRALLGNQCLEPGASLRSGLGFPTGLSLNHCVAHYTPNPGQKDVVVQYDDVMKVDFGVQINGWIVDSAFTMAFNPMYDNLLAAVKDATNTGIKTAGIDVRICDVSAAIQETMESYEVEIRGKVYPVKPVRNLCGHDIKHYHIHGEKMIPFTKHSDVTKMEEGEVFAIETFGSTGRGYTREENGIYGYGLNDDAPSHVHLPLSSANRVFKTVKENFGTLVFARRYLDRLGVDRYVAGLNCLVANGILEAYAPLVDVAGSYSAQFEHTTVTATQRDVSTQIQYTTEFVTKTAVSTFTTSYPVTVTSLVNCTKKPPAPSASRRTRRTSHHGQEAPLECDTVTSTQWVTATSTTTVLVPTASLVPTTILVPTVSIVPTTVTDRATVTQTRNQSVTVWVPTTYTATITRTSQYPVAVTSAHDVTVTMTATTTETIVTTLTTSYPVVSHETVTRTAASTVTQPASTITQPAFTVTQSASTVTRPASTVTQPASTSKITVCPAPTGLHAPLAPGSNLTFGCSPGSVCSPPIPRGCDVWPGPPSDDFVCRASECYPSPPFTQTHWPDNETSYYYPPSNGYFNLDPTEFGLAYDVFVDRRGRDHHHHAGQRRGQRGRSLMKRAPAPPPRCFDECNNAYLIAEAGGKTDELCRAGSSFRLGFELCTACIKTYASVSSSSTIDNGGGDDYIGSVFAQFLDFCNGRRSEPTSTVSAQQPSRSRPGAPDQALSSEPLLTTTQVGASSGGFEPSPSSSSSTTTTTTTAQATRSAATWTERPKTSSSVDSGAEDDKSTASNTGAPSAAKTSQSSTSKSSSGSSSMPEAGAVSSTAHHGGAAGEDESTPHATSTTPIVKSEPTSRDPPVTSSVTLTPKGTGTPLVLVNGVTGRCGLAGAAPALMVAMLVLII